MTTLSEPRPRTVPNASLVPSRTGSIRLDVRWPLARGGALSDAVVGYRRCGAGLAPRPVVAVLGGISAGRHVTACTDEPTPGWWEPMVGAGRAIDTNAFDVVSIDFLGGSGASTGPARDAAFPAVDTHDQARALMAVLDALGVGALHAVVGASYGGMVALALAERHPERVARAVVISAAHATHPMATALRSVQRGIVRLGLETGRASDAVHLARALAMTTYRTVEEFAERFGVEPRWTDDGLRFPVDDYLDHHGARFAGAFSPRSFLCLSESVDLHVIDPAAVTVPTTLIGVDGDVLVPAWQMAALRDALGAPASLHVVTSRYGHDAFLKEVDTVGSIIADALASRDSVPR